MQPYARFVQYIQRPHQTATQRTCKVYTLAFSSRKRIGSPRKGQVLQTHVAQILQARIYFRQKPVCHFLFAFAEFRAQKEIAQFVYRHLDQIVNGFAANLDIHRLFAQARTVAFGANRTSAITAQHHPVLNFVLVGVEEVEKTVQTLEISVPCPQQYFLFIGKLVIWFMHGESGFTGIHYQLLAVLSHFLSPPAGYRALIYGQCFIRYYEIFVYAYYRTEALAFGTSTCRAVEIEKFFISRLELYAVFLEIGRKNHIVYPANSPALEKRGFHRIRHTVEECLLMAYGKAFHHKGYAIKTIG